MKNHISSLEELKGIEEEPLVTLYTKKDKDNTLKPDVQAWSGLLIMDKDRPYLRYLLSITEHGDMFGDFITGYSINYRPSLRFKVSMEKIVNLETSDDYRIWRTTPTQKKRVIKLDDLFDPHIFTDFLLYSKDIKNEYLDLIKLIFKKIPRTRQFMGYDCYRGQSPNQSVLNEFKKLNQIMPYTFRMPYDKKTME